MIATTEEASTQTPNPVARPSHFRGEYLSLPAELATALEFEFQAAQSRSCVAPLVESERQRITADRILQFHFGGRPVACRRTDRGVIVLAAGEDEIAVLLRNVPAESRSGMVIEFPPPYEPRSA